MATPTRTYLSSSTGMRLAVPPHTVLPYLGTTPDPPPTGARVFGDPGDGNMYVGASKVDDNGREAYIGQRFGLSRTYFNNGTVEVNNGSGYQAAVSQAIADVARGVIPWLSFKLTTNPNAATKTYDSTWVEATAGKTDVRVLQILDGITAGTGGKGPVWITWHHEPNADGIASQYLAMNRHMQALMAPYPHIVHVGAVLSAGYYQMNGGGYNAADWMQPDSCDVFGLDIYNPWNPVNGKTYVSVDQAFRQGGIAECLAIDPNKPIALGELGVKTHTTAGRSATWMQDGYDYCRNANVIGIAWFDSSANSPNGGWILDRNYLEALESPAERLIKWKAITLGSTSKRIPVGGLTP